MNGLDGWPAVHRLPGRWAGRERFVVVDSRAEALVGFLRLWQAWQSDPARCCQLHCIVVARAALSAIDLRAGAGPALAAIAAELIGQLPPATPGLHRLAFEGGRLQLVLSIAAGADWQRDLVARADAIVITSADVRGAAVSGWDTRRIKSLARLAAADATLSIDMDAGSNRAVGLDRLADGLRSGGFRIDETPSGSGSTALAATFAPAFSRRLPAAGRPGDRRDDEANRTRDAIIVGAGLAGCATAWALAEHGWRTTLIDRHAAIASEASGNPGGVFHGVFHPNDGPHARFNRAAALEAQRAVRHAVELHGANGAVDGLLRLESAGDSVAAMRQCLCDSGLPPDYLQALDAAEASARCGIALDRPAWFYPGGGWVDPRALARSFLLRAASENRFVESSEVAALRDVAPPGSKRPCWQALDRAGRLLAEGEAVVLANAGDALRLSGWPWREIETGSAACRRVRGQLSFVLDATAGAPSTRLPLTGAGYLLPPSAGLIVFGATSQADDDDPAVRPADHAVNLTQLGRLTGRDTLPFGADIRGGRTAWRWVTSDRLPLIGGVPIADGERVRCESVARGSSAGRLDQPRWVERVPGLYLYAALGSRGIGWSALGAQIVAAWVSGAPAPVAGDLLDAVDPARLVARTVRRRAVG